MRKYYYYTYKGDKFYGHGVTYSDEAGFPISAVVEGLKERNNVLVIVDFWHEISADEYERLSETIGYNNDGIEKLSRLF